MQNASQRQGICQQPSNLPHTPVFIDRFVLSGVEIRVPARHVDQYFIYLRPRVLELWEPSSRSQIMVILVDLFQSVAYLEMSFKVICPVLFTAVHRDATIRTLKLDVSWGL